jgi:hypothetical protein
VQSRKHLERTLVLCCVVLAVFFSLACAFDEDGDFGVTPCLADGTSCSPDELSRALPISDTSRLCAAPPTRARLSAPGLLTAVPGGLCLLI